MKQIGQFLFSILMWAAIVLITIATSVSMCICSVLFVLFDPEQRIIHSFGTVWARAIIGVNPLWKIKIQGRGYIRNNHAYVFVANHQSMSDIVCVYCLGKQFKWVAKDSLFSVPLFGWAMSAARYIKLERGRHGSIRETFDKSLWWLEHKMSLLYFPEGTRSRTGQMGEFKNGPFKLAIRAKKPIVPIVLSGTYEAVQKGKKNLSSKIRCRVKVLKPVPTESYQENNFIQLKELVRQQMADALARM